MNDQELGELIAFAETYKTLPEPTHCPRCGAALQVAWKGGRQDSTEPPLFFCGPCYERTGEI